MSEQTADRGWVVLAVGVRAGACDYVRVRAKAGGREGPHNVHWQGLPSLACRTRQDTPADVSRPSNGLVWSSARLVGQVEQRAAVAARALLLLLPAARFLPPLQALRR